MIDDGAADVDDDNDDIVIDDDMLDRELQAMDQVSKVYSRWPERVRLSYYLHKTVMLHTKYYMNGFFCFLGGYLLFKSPSKRNT